MSRPRDPRMTALHDQLGAAFDDVIEMYVAEGVQLKLAPGTLLAGPGWRVLEEFRRRDEGGSLRWCKHLRPESPQPAIWLAWRPARLYCGPCMAQLPPLSSKEDRRCDACRSVQSKINQCRSMAPARLLPERDGKPAEARPPVVVMYGLCGRCKARTDAESKRAAAAAPVRFGMPAFARPLAPEEAAALRTAVAVARHYSRHEQDEMLAKVTAPGVDPYRVTWGLLVLAMYALNAVVLQAEPGPGVDRLTFGELLGRIVETVTQWEAHPLIKYPGELASGARKAAKVIQRVHDGDHEALKAITGDFRDLTLGGLALLSSVATMPVIAGLAADPEQVWTVMLDEISYWAAQDEPH